MRQIAWEYAVLLIELGQVSDLLGQDIATDSCIGEVSASRQVVKEWQCHASWDRRVVGRVEPLAGIQRQDAIVVGALEVRQEGTLVDVDLVIVDLAKQPDGVVPDVAGVKDQTLPLLF